ncbi:MAG: hypothetical protein CM15mP83_8940 [Flavobacteriaceae bacterium]|nr:MAG: hypothetical protein CM15mP83_8940 [Flavobacteriaceae bacterium]
MSNKWSANLFVHYNERTERLDKNDDKFLDMPLSDQVNILTRFQYLDAEKGWVSFFNVRMLHDNKLLGKQILFQKRIKTQQQCGGVRC